MKTQLKKTPLIPGQQRKLRQEYKRLHPNKDITFREFLKQQKVLDAGNDAHKDSGAHVSKANKGISIPEKALQGKIKLFVMMVDFDDLPGNRAYSPNTYRDLFFSQGLNPEGSLYDYYQEVSDHKIFIEGEVHGWIRMPHPYSYYVHNNKGYEGKEPNTNTLASDAAKLAVSMNLVQGSGWDAYGKGDLTGFVIIHSGMGYENTLNPNDIHSHQTILNQAVRINQNLQFSGYLIIPQACKLGLIAHELGHLVFGWDDFYDISDSPNRWAGTGDWDLMASGSWNYLNNQEPGQCPAHPMALHKLQHNWVHVDLVTSSASMVLDPIINSKKVIKISTKGYTHSQFLLLENRSLSGFDQALPGKGLLIWKVDLEQETNQLRNSPAVALVQADELKEMEASSLESGDDGDPFPGSMEKQSLLENGIINTSFGNVPSGLDIINIQQDGVTHRISFDIIINSKQPSLIPISGLLRFRGNDWLNFADGEWMMLENRDKVITGFQLNLSNNNLSLSYMAHLQKTGDTKWLSQGEFVGYKTGIKRLEGFAIKLEGTDAHVYSVEYMSKTKNRNETGICRDGEFCGTRGESLGLERIMVRIVKK